MSSWIAPLGVLLAAASLAFVATIGSSALVTLLRMRSGGMLDENALPSPGLLRRAEGVLLAAGITVLAAVGMSAAAIPLILEGMGNSVNSFAGWSLGLSWLVFTLLGLIGSRALGVSRPAGGVDGTSAVLWLLYTVLWPVVWILRRLNAGDSTVGSGISSLLPLSGQEIRGLLEAEDSAELVEEGGAAWARSVFELSETELSEIMVPRIDMVGINVETLFVEAVAIAAESRFTRLPVWEESQDRILGQLHTKDLLAAHARGESPSIRQLLREVRFLPESKRIDAALEEFRRGRVHLAVVVDEYGGTAGIVTLEDILEEIVGEIRDEFDQEGELLRLVDPHCAKIDPRIDLDDLNDELGLALPAGEQDTLGGLLYQLLGKVPKAGDSVSEGDLEFTIERVERQRICLVTLRSPEPFNGSHNSTPSAEEGA